MTAPKAALADSTITPQEGIAAVAALGFTRAVPAWSASRTPDGQ